MHYERDKDKSYLQEQAERKLEKLKKTNNSQYHTLNYKRLIKRIAKKIIEKNTQVLNKDDLLDIAKHLTLNASYLHVNSIKRLMKTEIAKKDVNNELMRILDEADLTKDKLKEIYKNSLLFATEKKDVTNLLKIAEKIERANSLVTNDQLSAPKQQYNTQINYSELRDNDQMQTKESASTPTNDEIEPKTQETESPV